MGSRAFSPPSHHRTGDGGGVPFAPPQAVWDIPGAVVLATQNKPKDMSCLSPFMDKTVSRNTMAVA